MRMTRQQQQNSLDLAFNKMKAQGYIPRLSDKSDDQWCTLAALRDSKGGKSFFGQLVPDQYYHPSMENVYICKWTKIEELKDNPFVKFVNEKGNYYFFMGLQELENPNNIHYPNALYDAIVRFAQAHVLKTPPYLNEININLPPAVLKRYKHKFDTDARLKKVDQQYRANMENICQVASAHKTRIRESSMYKNMSKDEKRRFDNMNLVDLHTLTILPGPTDEGIKYVVGRNDYIF